MIGITLQTTTRAHLNIRALKNIHNDYDLVQAIAEKALVPFDKNLVSINEDVHVNVLTEIGLTGSCSVTVSDAALAIKNAIDVSNDFEMFDYPKEK
jgi:hypothetical protein